MEDCRTGRARCETSSLLGRGCLPSPRAPCRPAGRPASCQQHLCPGRRISSLPVSFRGSCRPKAPSGQVGNAVASDQIHAKTAVTLHYHLLTSSTLGERFGTHRGKRAELRKRRARRRLERSSSWLCTTLTVSMEGDVAPWIPTGYPRGRYKAPS